MVMIECVITNSSFWTNKWRSWYLVNKYINQDLGQFCSFSWQLRNKYLLIYIFKIIFSFSIDLFSYLLLVSFLFLWNLVFNLFLVFFFTFFYFYYSNYFLNLFFSLFSTMSFFFSFHTNSCPVYSFRKYLCKHINNFNFFSLCLLNSFSQNSKLNLI